MSKNIMDQRWTLEIEPITGSGGDRRYLIVGEDGGIVAELQRPDHGSDELIAGYICGLQMKALAERTKTS